MDAAEIARTFDGRASTYDNSAMHRWQAEQVALFAGPTLGDLLDVGTGTGLALRAIATAARSLTGIDLSPRMLVVARNHLPTATLQVAHALHLPFGEASFDTVSCVSAITYMDAESALIEWARVLRHKGKIVVSSPATDGITATRLFRLAGRTHGIRIPDPNASTGSRAALGRSANAAALTVTRIKAAEFMEAGISSAAASFDTQMTYGFGQAITAAGNEVIERVRETFLQLSEAEPRFRHRILIAELKPASLVPSGFESCSSWPVTWPRL
jgi:SAM-dependent methyltransferase